MNETKMMSTLGLNDPPPLLSTSVSPVEEKVVGTQNGAKHGLQWAAGLHYVKAQQNY